jgi:hypothetical protein
MSSSIRKSCEQILHTVRSSNLNFSSKKKPFSLYFTVRKSIAKIPYSTALLPKLKDTMVVSQTDHEAPNEKIVDVNTSIRNKLEEFEKESVKLRDIIAILEGKVEKSEAGAFELMKNNKKLIEDKNEELKVLNSVIKNNNEEIVRLKNDSKENKKCLKAKEKEIHNLETKSYNQH